MPPLLVTEHRWQIRGIDTPVSTG